MQKRSNVATAREKYLDEVKNQTGLHREQCQIEETGAIQTTNHYVLGGLPALLLPRLVDGLYFRLWLLGIRTIAEKNLEAT